MSEVERTRRKGREEKKGRRVGQRKKIMSCIGEPRDDVLVLTLSHPKGELFQPYSREAYVPMQPCLTE